MTDYEEHVEGDSTKGFASYEPPSSLEAILSQVDAGGDIDFSSLSAAFGIPAHSSSVSRKPIKKQQFVPPTQQPQHQETRIESQLRHSDNPYFHTEGLTIYNNDILSIGAIQGQSIDLIVTSPPYNVDIKYNSHDDSSEYEDYLQFTSRWLTKCYQLAKADGRMCLNIPLDKNKGGQQSVCADITTIAKQAGWQYHSTIIWNEQNISRRTAWGSWLSASAPYVIAPVEVIIVLYKERWKKTSGSGKSDITKEEFLNWTNGVWTFSGESKKRIGHPAPFPVELPRRCIKLFSFVGDTILDPFLGSGSTLIASAKNNRQGIGVDVDDGYCSLAKKRLLTELKLSQSPMCLE